MRKTPYTLLTVSFIIVSLVGIMAFLPSPTIAETPAVSTTSEEDTAFIPTPQRPDNEAIWEIADYVKRRISKNKNVSFTFRKDFEITNFETFFQDNKEAFGIKKNDEIRFVKKEEDVYVYQQYYKGIKVLNGKYTITDKSKTGNYIRSSGYFFEGLDINIKPRLTKEEALQIALDSIKAPLYLWEDDKKCAERAKINLSCYPKTKFIIQNHTHKCYEPSCFSLHYSFEIEVGGNLPITYKVNIDATTGNISFFSNNIQY